MTVAELIEFLSTQPSTTTVKAWCHEAGDYVVVAGAVFSENGVLFLQTQEQDALLTSRDIRIKHIIYNSNTE